jgi:hypothetical protein
MDKATVYVVKGLRGRWLHGTRWRDSGGADPITHTCTKEQAIRKEVKKLPCGQLYNLEVNRRIVKLGLIKEC